MLLFPGICNKCRRSPTIILSFHVLLKQEAAALAATQVAFVLQSGQHRGLQFAITPAATVNPHPHQEQV